VTAAVALLQKEIEPDLYEQYTTLFRYQRTVTRHVHPSVNFWPDLPQLPSTNFPFLNWFEDNPSQITLSIEKEVKTQFPDLDLRTSSKATNIKCEGAEIFVDVDQWGPPH
jgi:hypothetical protein